MNIADAKVVRLTNPNDVKRYFSVRENHKDIKGELINIIASSGALLEGHFSLESGLHSKTFFRFSDIAGRADYIDKIAEALISDLKENHIKFDAILVQQSAGRVLGEALRRKLNKQIIVATVDDHNRPNGELINEMDLYRNDRVLIVSDLSTTGAALKKMIDLVRDRKAEPAAIAIFADRNKNEISNFENREKIKVFVLGDIAFENLTVTPEECNLCKESKPIPSWEV